ncbi:hypothetical protein LOK49_LG02G03187 [Camellia lanceoleosa]|uniref:Uncharacterized protein n=1 Tax=Camellia lanceoleosa TaxID=1840588 RepID=A0ACC0IHK9_9ERIC|nr:hypothetical protein LOK49_LG02G03187 [Camellia lanceoleosa]
MLKKGFLLPFKSVVRRLSKADQGKGIVMEREVMQAKTKGFDRADYRIDSPSMTCHDLRETSHVGVGSNPSGSFKRLPCSTNCDSGFDRGNGSLFGKICANEYRRTQGPLRDDKFATEAK